MMVDVLGSGSINIFNIYVNSVLNLIKIYTLTIVSKYNKYTSQTVFYDCPSLKLSGGFRQDGGGGGGEVQ